MNYYESFSKPFLIISCTVKCIIVYLQRITLNFYITMLQHIDLTKIPWHYSRCVSQKCPLSQTCLRSIAFRNLTSEDAEVTVVNPSLTSEDAGCRFYHSCTPVRFAYGLTLLQQKMFPQQYEQFSRTCIRHFGRNSYFRRRRGEREMPPEEQSYIIALARKLGVPEPVEFDSYRVFTDWRGGDVFFGG